MVDGKSRRGDKRDERGRYSSRGNGRGRRRRLKTLQRMLAADGLTRHGEERTIVWKQESGAPELPRQARASATGTDRGRLDLSQSARVTETTRSPRAAARGDQGQRLESAGPAMREISAPRCNRQAEGRGHHRDRPRDGKLVMREIRGIVKEEMVEMEKELEALYAPIGRK